MTGRAAAAYTLAALLWLSSRADAHALLLNSDPAPGAKVPRSPPAITLDFTEEPESRLSVVRVLDATGRLIDTEVLRPAPAHPTSLTIPLKTLPSGVYTVTWRVVSRIDGHATGGTFAFGVGTAPPTIQPEAAAPAPSPFSIAAHWLWYTGLFGLLGCAWTWTVASPPPPRAARILVWVWVMSVVGLAGVGQAQAADAGIGLWQLAGTSLGDALVTRAIPIIGAGIVIALAPRYPRQLRRLLAAVGIAAAFAVLAHVAAGHAGASGSSWRWLKITIQWMHVTAAGAWIGGLAAVLFALRGVPAEEKAVAARRYSTGAGIALGIVVGTGVLRAIDEVQAWDALVTSRFGQLVLVKIGLLLTLVALGAVNRYRSIPAIPTTLRKIRRVGAVELIVAGAVLVATGTLTGFPPPKFVREAEGTMAPLVAIGSDFATSVQVRLEVSPGRPGDNRFVAHLVDYDSHQPLEADRLTLRFTFEGWKTIPASGLPLMRQAAGVYAAEGSNLSLEGRWTITAAVERGVDSVEVPLQLMTRSLPQRVETIRVSGQPTLYIVGLPGTGSVQVYLDPERRGPSQLHVTFFDVRGQELPIDRNISIATALEDHPVEPRPVRRFGPGHFVGDVRLESGTWQLQIVASGPGGTILQAHLTIKI